MLHRLQPPCVIVQAASRAEPVRPFTLCQHVTAGIIYTLMSHYSQHNSYQWGNIRWHLVMKMMRRLPALLQSSATQSVRQWHKQAICWFTCGSHRLPQIHPIEIQITKSSGRSLILHTKEDSRLNTKPSPKTAAEMPTCFRASSQGRWGH